MEETVPEMPLLPLKLKPLGWLGTGKKLVSEFERETLNTFAKCLPPTQYKLQVLQAKEG